MLELSEADRQAFARDGYCLPTGALDAATVEAARAAVEAIWKRRVANVERRGGKEARDLGWLRARPELQRVHLDDPVLGAFCRHRFFAGVVRSLIGPDADLMWNQAHVKAPGGDLRTAVPFHQDTVYAQLDVPLTINCWTALTPSRRAQGPVAVIPGSHAERERAHAWDDDLKFFACAAPPGAPVAPELDPGMTLVFDAACVHGSRPNTDPSNARIGYSTSFVRAGARLRKNGELYGDRYPVLRGGAPIDEVMEDLARRVPAPTAAAEATHPGAAVLRELAAKLPDQVHEVRSLWTAYAAVVAAGDAPGSVRALGELLALSPEDVMLNGDLIRSRTDPASILREFHGIRTDYEPALLRRLLRRALELDPGCAEAERELARLG